MEVRQIWEKDLRFRLRRNNCAALKEKMIRQHRFWAWQTSSVLETRDIYSQTLFIAKILSLALRNIWKRWSKRRINICYRYIVQFDHFWNFIEHFFKNYVIGIFENFKIWWLNKNWSWIPCLKMMQDLQTT
jgi:hypothetical protein